MSGGRDFGGEHRAGQGSADGPPRLNRPAPPAGAGYPPGGGPPRPEEKPGGFPVVMLVGCGGLLIIALVAGAIVAAVSMHNANKTVVGVKGKGGPGGNVPVQANPGGKANPAEAKANLKAVAALQSKYHARFNYYADSFGDLGWAPAAPSHYSYHMPGEVMPPSESDPLSAPMDYWPFVTQDNYFIVAVGNVDEDATLDVWAVRETEAIERMVDDSQY